MINPQPNQPQPQDATLGGQTPPPHQGAILGGIAGVQQQLTHPEPTVRLAALDLAWSYGGAGLECLNQALNDSSKLVRQRARWLLRHKIPGAVVPPQLQWQLQERLEVGGYSGGYVEQFANYPVHEWQPGETDPIQPDLAYALRCSYEDEDAVISTYLDALLGVPNSAQLQALVLGMWSGGTDVCTGDASSQALVEHLASINSRLPQLKAIFVGDILSEESEISWIVQSNVSPLLTAYPELQVLQTRGGEGLRFQPLGTSGQARHEHLQALILESGGLSRETLQDIYAWELPALNHLELWFGSANYGGDCWVEDLAPILEALQFPNLTYLGLRNSSFADEMIDMLVQSPLLGGLQVLDLSLGTLTDAGAEKLLDYPAVRDLEILNVAENYLSGAMLDRLQGLGMRVIADEQRQEDEYDDPAWRRYCAVSE